MPKIKIAPSILSANQGRLQEEINEVENYSGLLQVDVMDNKFVPNITPQAELLKKFNTKIPLDIHLMVKEPSEEYIKTFINANKKLKINNITVHYEACNHLHRTLQAIKAEGMKAGVAINPHTSVKALEDIIQDIDLVCIMSVNPGFGGQSFIEKTYDKVFQLKEMIQRCKANTLIEIDGGVTNKNAKQLVDAGADVLVAGSYVFGAENPTETIADLKRITK